MIKITNISLPIDYSKDDLLKQVARKLRIKKEKIKDISLFKKSIDARKKEDVHYNISVLVSLENEILILKNSKTEKNISEYTSEEFLIPKSNFSKRPVVVGFGPAGIFAALVLAEAGACPIVIERGGDVDIRRKKVNAFWNARSLDEECNVQFGEGGAGTFSDGKLNTGTHDFRIKFVLEQLVRFGAPSEILYEAKPHIGTDKLSEVIKNIRNHIISLGGEVNFGARFVDFYAENGTVKKVFYCKNKEDFPIEADAVILAIGHSARDTFALLKEKGITLEQKIFSVGVRIEHLQSSINKALYGEFADKLGAAPYKLAVRTVTGKSLYSFCMCPGGYVVAASSECGGVVTNGMSNFARDGINANSALLVNVTPEDLKSSDPLAGVVLQRKIERKAFKLCGEDYSAPVSLVGDYLKGAVSKAFGNIKPSYLPSCKFVLPDEYLPSYVTETLRLGILQMGKMISGFDCYDAVLTGPETRSSSPVRITRGKDFNSLTVKGLYPCGEGAGYAGGIVSAAVDGIKCVENCCHNKQIL